MLPDFRVSIYQLLCNLIFESRRRLFCFLLKAENRSLTLSKWTNRTCDSDKKTRQREIAARKGPFHEAS